MSSINSYFAEEHLEWSTKEVTKNLKELIAPAGVNIGMSVGPNYHRDTPGKCVKCGIYGTSNRGRKRKSGIYVCQVVKEGNSFKSNQTGEVYKKSGKILTVEAKT